MKSSGQYQLKDIECLHYTLKPEVHDLIESAFGFDHIINGRGFLNPSNIDSWNMQFDGQVYYDMDTLQRVKANFIVGTTSKNRVSHSGILYVNEKDYSIPKIEYQYDWMKMKPKRVQNDLTRWYRDKKWHGYAYYGMRGEKYKLIKMKYDVQRDFYKGPRNADYIESENFVIEYDLNMN